MSPGVWALLLGLLDTLLKEAPHLIADVEDLVAGVKSGVPYKPLSPDLDPKIQQGLDDLNAKKL